MTTTTHCDCPRCNPRKYLLTIQRVANIVENMGLTEQQVQDRVDYILEGVK